MRGMLLILKRKLPSVVWWWRLPAPRRNGLPTRKALRWPRSRWCRSRSWTPGSLRHRVPGQACKVQGLYQGFGYWI
ncbi:hypothetical protein D3C72_1351970 [compost metagenome]